MPSVIQISDALTEPKAPKLAYTQVAETQHDRESSHSAFLHLCALLTCRAHLPVDWADLVTLDLAKFDEPGGKEFLARQLFEALQTIGFFYIVNFGLAQEEIDRQFAIGKAVFDLPTEEKLLYRADLENGGYNGYKPLGLRVRSQSVYTQGSRHLVNVSLTRFVGNQARHLRQHRDLQHPQIYPSIREKATRGHRCQPGRDRALFSLHPSRHHAEAAGVVCHCLGASQ